MHALLPPDGDRLLALAGDARRLVLGALVRAPSGWRFVARDVTLPDGKYVTDGVPLGDGPVRASVEAMVKRLVLPAPPPPKKPRVWWPYAVAAAGVTFAALTVALGLAFGDQPSGTVGGTVK